jgi:spermidine synthase
MSVVAVDTPHRIGMAPVIFTGAIFTSAALVFMVEPMIAKMILPQLGGSPAVWNTSMAFFQAMLLIGYSYAHLLQRLASAKVQFAIHLFVLAGASLFLPVAMSHALGAPPQSGTPIFWLLGVLSLSVGAPFAALSATAPLLQAWYVHAQRGDARADNPYILYGASNLGSMLALLAYPLALEPLLALNAQGLLWSWVYVGFCVLILATLPLLWRDDGVPTTPARHSSASSVRDRLLWILLAAAPSSLMLGATTYISNDVASVPLLWVMPLALYLLTFILAFQERPWISGERALLWQAAFVATAAGLLCINQTSMAADLIAYLGAFFFSALVCHQALVASRPHARDLTEFYLCMSLGGVLGGVFNALVAPVVFRGVYEFPLVLTLACLARPWGEGAITRRQRALAAAGIAAAIALALMPNTSTLVLLPVFLAIAGGLAAGFVSARGLLFTTVIGALCLQAIAIAPDKRDTLLVKRSFFGVNRVTADSEAALGGTLHVLFHGTTIHGAQPLADKYHCLPTTYYAPSTPIGQTFAQVLRAKSRTTIAVVGLGTGSVAAYTRAGDRMRFFEIDPDVARIAKDPAYFSYVSTCAKGAVDVVLGDARLTLAREPAARYDLLQLDAFSGDSVPTHLLTVQALAVYFRVLKPDGILIFHITNRNLNLEPALAATAKRAGLATLMQDFVPPSGTPGIKAAPTQAMLMARNAAVLDAFARDKRWRRARDNGSRAWTDDYINIVAAIADRAFEHR